MTTRRPSKRQVAAQRPLGEFDVARLDVVDALGAAQIGRAGQHRRDVAVHQRLDPRLDLVGQLVAVGAEQLDAVVLIGIVRGRDHHAEVAAHRAGQHRDRRRRHRAEQQDVDAHRGEAGDQGVFDHVARQARVLADHDPVAMVAALKREPGGLADLHRDFRGDLGVGPAANAVGAEIFAPHLRKPPPQNPRDFAKLRLNNP